MIYAQIKENIVTNILYVTDSSVLNSFDSDFSYDDITNVSPVPGVGWTYVSSGVYTAPTISVSVAIQKNLSQFQLALQAFISSRYVTDVRLNFIGMYENAILNNLTNRQAYIAQLFVWQNLIIEYAATYIATVKAMTDSNAILATTWDFSSLAAADPLLSPMAAIQINN